MLQRAILLCGISFGCVAHAGAQDTYFGGVWITNLTPAPAFNSPEIWGSLGPNMAGGAAAGLMSIDSNLNMKQMGGTLGGISFACAIVDTGEAVNSSVVFGPLSNGFPYQMTAGQPFFIGIDLATFYFDSNQQGQFAQARYGWAELVYSPSGLNVLDSAMTASQSGIIAGTTTVLPEPSSISILLSGIIGIALLYRHRVQQLK
jgi:hypothetical protein